MNKNSFCLFFILSCFSLTCAAQCDTIRLNESTSIKKLYIPQPIIIKTNPFAVLWGSIPFTAEYRIMAEIPMSKRQSSQIGISYLNKSLLWLSFEKKAHIPNDYILLINGYRIQIAHKIYIGKRNKSAPFGFYLSPAFSFSNAHIAIGLDRYYKHAYFDFRHFNANLIMGTQIGRSKSLTMDLFFGLGYKKNKVLYHATDKDIKDYDTKEFGKFYNSPVSIIAGINWGIAR